MKLRKLVTWIVPGDTPIGYGHRMLCAACTHACVNLEDGFM